MKGESGENTERPQRIVSGTERTHERGDREGQREGRDMRWEGALHVEDGIGIRV